MSGLFEHIAMFDDGERVAGRQAAAVAQKRIADRVGNYLKIAKSPEEYEARLTFVEDEVRQIVADVAEEYNADLENLQEAIDEHLKGDGVTDLNEDLEDAPSAVGHKAAGGHASDCTCGFCANKGKLPGSSDDDGDEDDESEAKESSTGPLGKAAGGPEQYPAPEGSTCENCGAPVEHLANDYPCPHCGQPTFRVHPELQQGLDNLIGLGSTKTAEADRDGGGAVTTEKLPTGDGETVGTEPSPKIDKKQWKPNALNDSGNLKPVDTETTGTPVPTVEQDITDTAEYKSQGEEGDSFLDQTDSVVDQQTLPTADETGQSTERNISQDGQSDTWSTAENDPVTSEVLSSTDPDQNPLRTILESGFTPDDQVESAIREFNGQ